MRHSYFPIVIVIHLGSSRFATHIGKGMQTFFRSAATNLDADVVQSRHVRVTLKAKIRVTLNAKTNEQGLGPIAS